MRVLWDTSCLLPLVLKEPNQSRTLAIWESSEEHVAWSWFRVEAEAACVRQRVTSEQWKELRSFVNLLGYIDILPTELDSLLTFNRTIGLRSADAGHLFCFMKLFGSLDDMVLATYDKEMIEAAQKLALPLHPLCLES